MPPIADKIDAAIGSAPPEAPALDTTLALGRRALRRRRAAYGVGATATALVIGGTAWALAPGDAPAPRTDDFVAVPSDPAPSDPASSDPGPSDGAPAADSGQGGPWWGADAARLNRAGDLEIRPGWSISEDMSGAGWSAVEVEKGARLQWFLFGRRMTISDTHAPALGYDSFQAWVDVNVPLLDDRGPNGDDGAGDWPGVPRDDLVEFGNGEALVALAGVTIVEQRPSPDVGESFATASDISAVALVETDGERWYVLARDLDGPAQYIAVPERKGGADLDAFLELARERYAEGGGGLL